LRDLVEDLDTVTTLDQLLHALALTAQHCQVATAKTKFMVVPTDDDLAALLTDVEQTSPPHHCSLPHCPLSLTLSSPE
jgi:hypothetical protein